MTDKIKVTIDIFKLKEGLYRLYGETYDIRDFEVSADIPCTINKNGIHNKGISIALFPHGKDCVYTFTVAEHIFNDDKMYHVLPIFCGRGTFEIIIIDEKYLDIEPMFSTEVECECK